MASFEGSLDDAFSAFFAAEYYAMAALALVVYDWLVSLDDEIRCFWASHNGRRKLKGGTILYVLSRYPPIIHLALSVRSDMPMSSDKACRINFGLQTAMLVWYALIPASFSALRVYALSSHAHKKTLPLLTFLLLFVPNMATLVINTYVEQPVVLPSPWNCTVINKPFIPPWLLSSNLEIATRACSIAGDLLVLFVTWANTYTSYKTQRRLLGGPTLVGVMLQNGSIYFILLTIMNAMCIIPQTIVKAALFETFATVVISPLTAILTCRFLLDLHHANDAATSGPTSTPSMDLHFAGGFDLQFQGPGSSTLMAPGPSGSVSRGTTAELPAFIASTGEQVYMHLGTGQSFEFLDQDVGGGQRTDSGGGVREFELTSSRGDSGGARRADVERQGRRTHDSEDGFTVSCRLGDAGARVAA